MLSIWLTLCRQAGITEVLVNLHAHAEIVRDYLERHESRDTPAVRLSEEPILLGSAGTLRAHRDWVASEDIFWVFYSNVLTSTSLGRMLAFHRSKRQPATLGVYEVPDPRRCGIVTADENGIVRKFVEKPAEPEGNLAFAGLMVASPAILADVPETIPSDIGFDVLPRLVGRMAAWKISEFLIDIGTKQNYAAAQQSWPGLASG